MRIAQRAKALVGRVTVNAVKYFEYNKAVNIGYKKNG